MLCANLATRRDGFQFPCGQCVNCRINRRREWQARLLLEAATHDYGTFVTLTYQPVEGPPPVVLRSHLHAFFRVLREQYPDLRYFAAAEYGSHTGRAHYHAHIFTSKPLLPAILRQAWPFGIIHQGDTEPASLDYCLGYLLKDRKLLTWPIESRFPEFRLYSQGMGKHALAHLLLDGTELPREFRVFGKKWPIGRYLRDRAKRMGYTVTEREAVVLEALQAKALRPLLLDSKATQEQIEKAYSELWEAKAEKSAALKRRAIRAAYLQQLNQQRTTRNETL